ncbi:MAG: hypothetical protein P8O16_14090 [Algoriphagus sp.]|uniref:outer membrane beta-barrel protein n=1 Tax=Algoriphagus sp. TaxID=1872435 RepID=UPI0026118975|nr:outer membrane beta-barrel protein [Algoriphagus sp.]MDG1278409.1 hypothetical protein [Algoriphagus sp.]
MKKIIVLVCILGVHFGVFAQSSLEVKGYFGISSTQLARKAEIVGVGGVEMNTLNEFGFLLSKSISEKFRLTGGVGYSFGEVRFQPPFCSNCGEEYNLGQISNFRMLSFPIYAEYTLGRYFYAAAGPIIDLELSNKETYSDQSGIGYLIGLGARWKAEKFTFSIFPNYKRHGMIPFDNSSKFKHVLQEIGVQVGVRYSF